MDSILLVEDDAATRTWLAGLLADCPEVELAHESDTLGDAMNWLATHQPDIVLTDLGLPDGSGLEVIRETVRRYPHSEVLVLSIFGDEGNIIAAIDAGAGGYLLKDGSLDSIREHLACLKSGGSPLSPRIARTLIKRYRAPAQMAPAPTEQPVADALLSERELDVLTGIGKGFSYAEVAQALGVSTNTVRTHIRRIYEKLSVNSRAEAVYEYNRRMLEQGKSPIQ
jgi:DNA-binding NarL/FixJ family response regulator